MKKVLVILAHPNVKSFCGALADSYCEGAREAGHEVKRLNLAELSFSIAQSAMPHALPLEPDILAAREAITRAEHLVVIGPVWWGNWPALAVGFFERTFGEGFAINYDSPSGFPKALLSGRTAHVITTSGAPAFVIRFLFRDCPARIMKNCLLGLCGIKTIAVTRFGAFSCAANQKKRESMLARVRASGKSLH